MKIATALFALCALAASIAWFNQCESTRELRSEIRAQRDRADELVQVNAEHAKLLATAISADDLQALRDDHAAVVELRSELSALQRQSRATAP